jgi:hypothetical protein
LITEDTVVSAGIIHLDEIVYEEIEEEGEPVDERVEGFGGTALVGARSKQWTKIELMSSMPGLYIRERWGSRSLRDVRESEYIFVQLLSVAVHRVRKQYNLHQSCI